MSAAGSKVTEVGLLTVLTAGIIVTLGMILGPKVHHAGEQLPTLTQPTPTQAIGQAVRDLGASPFALVLAALFIGIAAAIVVVALTGERDES